MAIKSSGPLSIAEIAAEFNDAPPHSISEFYGAANGLPTSGAFAWNTFYSKSSAPVGFSTYRDFYHSTRTGNVVSVDANGSVFNLDATVDAMSDGDYLELAPGEYTISNTLAASDNTYTNSWNRNKNICFAGTAADPKDVILTVLPGVDKRDWPVFCTEFTNDLHIYNLTYKRAKTKNYSVNYTNAFIKHISGATTRAGGRARNVIFDAENLFTFSWVYQGPFDSNSLYTLEDRTFFRDCSFVNYITWQVNYSNTTARNEACVVRDCAYELSYGPDHMIPDGVNPEFIPFDSDYAYHAQYYAGHRQGEYSLLTLPNRDDTAHRYWRILVTQVGQGETRVVFPEIEMDEGYGITTDVTSAAFAIASAERDPVITPATAAFDNNGTLTSVSSGFYWETPTGETAGHWIGQDFGAGNEKSIKTVRIWQNSTYFLPWADIQYSDDGVNWTTKWSMNSPYEDVGTGAFDTSIGIAAREDLYESTGATRILAVDFDDNTITNQEAGAFTVQDSGVTDPTITAGGGAMNTEYYGTGWGASKHLKITDILGNGGLIAYNDWTFVAWYKGTQTNVSGTSWSPGVPIFGDPRNSVYAGLGLNNGHIAVGYNASYEGTTNVADDQWHCLVWTFNAYDYVIDMYVDGVYEASTIPMTSYTTNMRFDHIGWGYPYANVEGPTALDGIQVYQGKLTPSEIKLIANGGVAEVATDPYWNNVRLLAHFDESLVNEVDGQPLTATHQNVPLYDTTNKQFGTAALNADGDTRITFAGGFTPGTGPYTIEGWARSTSSAGTYNQFISSGGPQTHAFQLLLRDGGYMTWMEQGTVHMSATTVTKNDNTWHHYAVTRDESNVARLFVDGVLQDSYTDIANYNTTLAIGSWDGTENWYGDIDEIRITEGVCRYTSNFTVPTEAFPSVGSVDSRLVMSLDTSTYSGSGDWLDATSNGNNATLGSTTVWNSVDKAFEFNSLATDLMTVAYDSTLDTPTGATYEFVVKTTSVDAEFFNRGISDPDDNPRLGNFNTNMYIDWQNNYGNIPWSSYDGIWKNLVITVIPNGPIKVYVDGVKVHEFGVNPATIHNSANPIEIGGVSWVGRYFSGGIKRVNLYNEVLTDAEIAAL